MSQLQLAVQETGKSRPKPAEIVTALVKLEKAGKKTKETVSYQQLLGKWRLWFITGTKKTRQRAGVMLGAGRYLPPAIKVYLSYSKNPEVTLAEGEAGKVENSVSIAGFNLILSGPTKFFPKQKLLAFDFTKLTIKLFGKTIYSGNIRGGKNSMENFYQQSIKKQAFFRYFLIEDNLIAARGKGGGLAFWRREE
ncbi:MAG: hypothetical protein BRC33_03060 [Cyanobacteria bacterium SW_9_44_58]|nr:MAG: hypothetical protein BRC33_03060 [Cyanobacteria bacterium SW_9_44_58]